MIEQHVKRWLTGSLCGVVSCLVMGCLPALVVGKPEPVFLGDRNSSAIPAKFLRVGGADSGGYYGEWSSAGDKALWQFDESVETSRKIFYFPDDPVNFEAVVELDGFRYVSAAPDFEFATIYKLKGQDLIGQIGDDDLQILSLVGVLDDSVVFTALDENDDAFIYRWAADGQVVQIAPCDNHPAYANGELVYYQFEGVLWRTDGTMAGTFSVMADESMPLAEVFGFVGGRLVFTNLVGPLTWDVIGTDGSLGNAEVLASGEVYDFYPDGSGEAVFWILGGDDVAYYFGTDGTAAGTHLICKATDIGANPVMGLFGVFSDKLVLRERIGTITNVLLSDGTPQGTHVISANHTRTPAIYVVGDYIYLMERDFSSVATVYVSDGTENSARLVDLSFLPVPPVVSDVFEAFGQAVFLVFGRSNQDYLLKYDPDTQAFSSVRGPFTSMDFPVRDFVAFGDKMFFEGFDGDHGTQQWITDGTGAGTIMLGDWSVENTDWLKRNRRHAAAAGTTKAFFTANGNDPARFSLIRTDGTVEGTAYEVPVTRRSEMINNSSLVLEDVLYFITEPAPGVFQLADYGHLGPRSISVVTSQPELAPVGNGVAVLDVDSGVSTLGVYRSATNSFESLGLDPFPRSAYISNYVKHQNRTLLEISDEHTTLVVTDGTAQGTVSSGKLDGDVIMGPVVINETTAVMVLASAAEKEARLLAMGLSSGEITTVVEELDWAASGVYYNPLNADTFALLDNGKLVFGAPGVEGGVELWITDGYASGTSVLKDINVGPDGSDPADFTAAGDRVYFIADDGVHGRELWQTDGTAAGTSLVADVNPGAENGLPYSGWANFAPHGGYKKPRLDKNMVYHNGQLLFPGNDGTGYHLWYLSGPGRAPVRVELSADLGDGGDGAGAGAGRVRDAGGLGGTDPGNFVLMGDRVLFQAWTPETGRELWSVMLEEIPSGVVDWGLY